MAISDATLPELDDRVRAAFIKSPYFSRQREVLLATDDGCVTLKGTVHTFFQKQMAQEIVKSVDGVSQIENQLEVAAWS